MAPGTAEWRLRTRTGQELTITAGDAGPAEVGAGAARELAYPQEFLPSDIEEWLSGPDAWSRRAVVEMCEALRGGDLALAHGASDDDLARAARAALLDGFQRGELRVRVRAPVWEMPPPESALADEQPAPAADTGPPAPAPTVREQRRIAVRLGDLDAVFEPVATIHGKKQRLQALGHYYERFDASTGGASTPAFESCVAYWRAKREGARGRAFAADAELEADLQAEVRRFVVAGGALPAPGAEARIRLPGAVGCERLAELEDGGVPDGHPLPSVRFGRETEMWDGHGALGKIPIVVRVEVRRDGRWIAAAGEQVHFQLIPPFHDDPGAELADVRALRDRSQRPAWKTFPGGPAERRGPQQFVAEAIAHEFDEQDPQRYNAHRTRGGKRGLDVLGNIFGPLPARAFPDMGAPEASPAPRAHAVRVATNAAGEAGVLFLPARTAGDRYRLRIFLDPNDGAASDGTGRDAVAFETGRLCVWRHVLWSTYLAKPPPRYPPADSVAGVQARLATLGYDVGEIDGEAGARTEQAVREFQRAHHLLPQNGRWDHGPTQAEIDRTVRDYVDGGESYPGFGPAIATPRFATVAAELRRMYCELEVEPAGGGGGRAGYQLSPELHRAALRWAIQQVQASPPCVFGMRTPRDVAAMFSEEFETPFLFEIRHPRHYNRLMRPGFAGALEAHGFRKYWRDAGALLSSGDGLLRHFLRYLAVAPGLTVATALAASRLSLPPREHGQIVPDKNVNGRNSGLTFWDRASAVFGGLKLHARGIYGDDGFTKTILHELGHVLLLRHQFQPDRSRHPASFREDHDSSSAVVDPKRVPAPVPYDRCLMGYLPCEGELCGKCHLKLRGWDISRMPT